MLVSLLLLLSLLYLLVNLKSFTRSRLPGIIQPPSRSASVSNLNTAATTNASPSRVQTPSTTFDEDESERDALGIMQREKENRLPHRPRFTAPNQNAHNNRMYSPRGPHNNLPSHSPHPPDSQQHNKPYCPAPGNVANGGAGPNGNGAARPEPYPSNDQWASAEAEIASLRAQLSEARGQVQHLQGILASLPPPSPMMSPVGMWGPGVPLPPWQGMVMGDAYGAPGQGMDPYGNGAGGEGGQGYGQDGYLSPHASQHQQYPNSHPRAHYSPVPGPPQYAPSPQHYAHAPPSRSPSLLNPAPHSYPHYSPPAPPPQSLPPASSNSPASGVAAPMPQRASASAALLNAIMRRSSPPPTTTDPASTSPTTGTGTTTAPAPPYRSSFPDPSPPITTKRLPLAPAPLITSHTSPSPLSSLLDSPAAISHVDAALAQLARARSNTVHTSKMEGRGEEGEGFAL